MHYLQRASRGLFVGINSITSHAAHDPAYSHSPKSIHVEVTGWMGKGHDRYMYW